MSSRWARESRSVLRLSLLASSPRPLRPRRLVLPRPHQVAGRLPLVHSLHLYLAYRPNACHQEPPVPLPLAPHPPRRLPRLAPRLPRPDTHPLRPRLAPRGHHQHLARRQDPPLDRVRRLGRAGVLKLGARVRQAGQEGQLVVDCRSDGAGHRQDRTSRCVPLVGAVARGRTDVLSTEQARATPTTQRSTNRAWPPRSRPSSSTCTTTSSSSSRPSRPLSLSSSPSRRPPSSSRSPSSPSSSSPSSSRRPRCTPRRISRSSTSVSRRCARRRPCAARSGSSSGSRPRARSGSTSAGRSKRRARSTACRPSWGRASAVRRSRLSCALLGRGPALTRPFTARRALRGTRAPGGGGCAARCRGVHVQVAPASVSCNGASLLSCLLRADARPHAPLVRFRGRRVRGRTARSSLSFLRLSTLSTEDTTRARTPAQS